jgi:hypothetical protein
MNAYIKCMAKQVQFQDFDEYFSKTSAYWRVYLPSDCSNGNWKSGNCNCPSFSKNYTCKHLVGLAVRNNYVKVPKICKDVYIETKKNATDQQGLEKLWLDSLFCVYNSITVNYYLLFFIFIYCLI